MTKKRILVIKHGALGDMIFADGAFQAIKQYHADDEVILLTTSAYAEMMRASGYFNAIWIDNRPRPFSQPITCLKLFKRIRSANFDRIYDLQKSRRTKKYMWLTDHFFNPKPAWCTKHEGAKYAYTDPSSMINISMIAMRTCLQKRVLTKFQNPILIGCDLI
jgi:ADP-heptose:LPS heptosyltransferase